MLLSSCREKQGGHLPPDKMQKVLFDIHLAESYSMVIHQDSLHRNTERNLDSLAVFYKMVFDHHKVTQKDFLKSIDWYRLHPEELDSIYINMLPEFNKMEAKYESR